MLEAGGQPGTLWHFQLVESVGVENRVGTARLLPSLQPSGVVWKMTLKIQPIESKLTGNLAV